MGKRNRKPPHGRARRKIRRTRIPSRVSTLSCVLSSVPADPPRIAVSSQKSVRVEIRILSSSQTDNKFSAKDPFSEWTYLLKLVGTSTASDFFFSFQDLEKMIAYRAGLTSGIADAPKSAQVSVHKVSLWGIQGGSNTVMINTVMPFPFGDVDASDSGGANARSRVGISLPAMWSQVGTVDTKYGVTFRINVPHIVGYAENMEVALVQISGTVRSSPT